MVEDRIGLVTPRVVCMIINEAYYAVLEGTASREDVDLAMKLGSNYPFGPFEWSNRIGVKHVYELLEAVYEDTRDERYKICPLLKKEYLAAL
jgi:3-hydroxybutyryl-CoA dehydrogenase